MELMTSWERKGRQEGIREGQQATIVKLLTAKVGVVSPEITEKINALSPEQLDALGIAMLGFKTGDDAKAWFAALSPAPLG